MSTKNQQPGTSADELHDFASSPCYLHETGTLESSSGWDAVNAWRKQTRSQLFAYRNGLTEAEHTERVAAILQRLRDNELLAKHECIGFYWPMAGEIDLRPLLAELVAAGKTAALPVIVAPKQPLEFWRWQPGDVLDESGPWGIPAPAVRNVVAVTAVLAPLLGFDASGHRLGFGGGYYDRTLASMHPRPATIGVAFEGSRLRSIYPQDHDIPMDFVVTDAAVHTS